ncbi:MAG: flagellar basal body rod protein FlgC [Ignavibacteria bacterium]|nr:flagellar basal body rod protein FlgC [Ignavibacteria bacterium]
MKSNIFEIFKISGEGLRLQRLRLSCIAKNIANSNTTKTVEGKPYQREIVQVRSREYSPFEQVFLPMLETNLNNNSLMFPDSNESKLDVQIIKDTSPPRKVFDPSHPDADENGYLHYPNINVITEMVEMISAQRAFEANVSIIEAAKNIARDSMDI